MAIEAFKSLTPNLMVDDVNETVNFYRDILGFNVLILMPETGVADWAMLEQGNVKIMFQKKASLIEEYPVFAKQTFVSGGAMILYIEVPKVRELFEQLKGKAKLVRELSKTCYCMTEFAIQDNNGFVLAFAEREQVCKK
jgi:lactoylglutathione lyase